MEGKKIDQSKGI